MARRQIAAAVTAGLGGASVPRLSIKGGAFTLVDSVGEQKPVETRYLDCVIIDVQVPAEGGAPIQRIFWGLDESNQPKAFDDSGAPPICFSDNGVGASINAAQPQNTSCAACTFKQFNWVSKMDLSKRTSACRPIKKIAVLPMQAVEFNANKEPVTWEPMYEIAFLLSVPVMSHDNLAAYSHKFKGQKFDITEVITRITFVHGAVGLLDFDAVGRIDDETNAFIDKVLDSHATDILVGRGDIPWKGALPASGLPPQPQIPAAAVQIAPPAPPPPPATPFAAQAPQAETPKRTRKPKADAQSAPAADRGLAPFAQTPKEEGIPPFLRRNAQAPGIQQDAPAPTPEIEAALKSVFDLKVP